MRSVIAVPAGSEMDEGLLASKADAILLGVDDADVAPDEARQAAVAALQRASGAGKSAFVRVNHPRTHLLRDDLTALLSPALAGVFVSHCSNPQDVRDTAVLLRELELAQDLEPGSVAVYAVIDTARGLLRAAEIVDAAPRVAGLLFDAEAYARDTGARAEENGSRLAYARGAVVAAARAFDRLPLVTSSGLEMRFLAQHGFAGAVLNDARLAGTANSAFGPTSTAVKRAKRHRDAYEADRQPGAWVARIGTEMVDAHSARKAAQALEFSEDDG